MAITTVPNLGPDPFTVNASVLNGKVDPLVTDYNGNIDNTNIASGAAIANSKLNLATIAQAVTMTGGLTISTTALTMSSMPLNEAKGSDIASATTPNITSATGNTVHITGTTTITGFATATAGIRRILIFDGILTFTHNATSLILPTGANITTAAGDTAIMVSEGSGNWRCVSYNRKDGTPLTASTSAASQSDQETGTSTTTYVSPGRQHFHQSAAKFWGQFDGTGTPAFGARYNLDASITDNGTGDYTISITTDLSSGNYALAGMAINSGASLPCIVSVKNGTTPAGGSFNIQVWRTDTAALQDVAFVCVVGYGDI